MAKPGKKSARPASKARLFAGIAVAVIAAGAVALVLRSAIPAGGLPRSGAAAGYNVLLVTLDTVRQDRIGAYGYGKAETPVIDALAAEGICFDEAVTSVPITLPSHSTIMTGLYPPHNGVRDNGLFRLAPEQSTLAERLKGEGYDTAAFIGCFVLDERFGLGQGFDLYDFQVTREGFQMGNFDFNQRGADAVSQAAIRWLKGRSRSSSAPPFFMWVHYFDAHVPLQSPLAELPRFEGRPYDAEIAFVDMQLGRLLDEIDRAGLRDRTLIALVADHGEGLKEHGESTHGLFVYDSTLRVPFILSSPTLFRGGRRVGDRLAGLVDLRPTLEDLLGLPLSPSMDGKSLLRRGTGPDRSVYIETKMPYDMAHCSPLYGIRRLKSKYVDAPEPELYDLAADPNELDNLYDKDRERAAGMAKELSALRTAWSGDEGRSAAARAMSREEMERLRALGYVQASGRKPGEEGDLPDPKAFVRSSRLLTEAIELQGAGRLDDAIDTAREALDECEGSVDARTMLAEMLREAGRPDEAIDLLRRSLRERPLCGTALQLARTFMSLRRYTEMEEALRTAARLDPGNGFVHVIRGERFSLQERLPEAIAEFEKALEIDEHRTGLIARENLKNLRQRLGQR